MAAAYVQSAQNSSGSAGTTIATSGIATTTGNAFIVVAIWDNGGGTTASCADNKSNTFSTAVAKFTSPNNTNMQAWYVLNGSGGSGHTFTVTISGSVAPRYIIVHEVSGIATSAALDKTATTSHDAGTAVACGPVTPTTDGQYIFAAACNDDGTGAGTLSASGSFTERNTASPGNYELQSEDYVQPTAASISAAWTLTNTEQCLCLMATFKAAAGASGKLFRRSSLSGLGAGGPFFHDPLSG